MVEAMDVDPPKEGEKDAAPVPGDDDEEQIADLLDLLDQSEEDTLSSSDRIPLLSSILTESQNRYGPKASGAKERAIYGLARAYCGSAQYDEVVNLLTGDTCRGFFDNATKAKCAKVVRAVLDIVCGLAPEQLEMVSGNVARPPEDRIEETDT
jgi:hypothetical protein